MTTAPEGISLLGSEMLTWSDLDGEVGGFGGLVAPHLLHGFEGARGRVLIAGPATAEVIDEVAQQFDAADVLTRSWLDAQALRPRLGPSVALHCGPLDRVPRPDGGYDAVVAVDGLDRLHSAEEDTPPWQDVLALLTGLLGEAGELYVAIGNPVGVDRLVELPAEGRDDDAAWPQGRAGVDVPGEIGEVLDRLSTAHGLTEVETWVCHGPRTAPTVAAPRRVLEELRADPVLLRVVAGAYAGAGTQLPSLRSPAEAARDLVRAGLGVATAPLSVLHLRRGENPSDQPMVLLVREPGAEAKVAYRLEHDGSGWSRGLLVPAVTYDAAPGMGRDLSRLEGPVPGGVAMSEVLADHCAQHDITGAGVVVRRLRDWLGERFDSPVDPLVVPLTLDGLVASGDSFAAVDRSFAAHHPSERDVVLLRMLLRFADELLSRGGRHPWSAAATPRALATSLAAAAGLEVGGELYERAASLDRELQPKDRRPAEFEAPLGGALSAMSYADLVDLTKSLAERAAAGDAHVVWLLRAMQTRQRAIRKARGKLREVSNSREYRLGRKVFWVRERVRRRQERQEQDEQGPAGEWRDPSQDPEAVDRDAPVEVEAHLLPPGYQPTDQVDVIPSGTDKT